MALGMFAHLVPDAEHRAGMLAADACGLCCPQVPEPVQQATASAATNAAHLARLLKTQPYPPPS